MGDGLPTTWCLPLGDGRGPVRHGRYDGPPSPVRPLTRTLTHDVPRRNEKEKRKGLHTRYGDPGVVHDRAGREDFVLEVSVVGPYDSVRRHGEKPVRVEMVTEPSVCK